MTDTEWIRVTSISELQEADGLIGRRLGAVDIALYEVDGAYFATSNMCTHGQARLSDGYLDGFLIECPLHQGLFDVRTGEAKGPPCWEPLRSFEVRPEGNDLLVSRRSLDEALVPEEGR